MIDAISGRPVSIPGGQGLQDAGEVNSPVETDSAGCGRRLPLDAAGHGLPVEIHQVNLCEAAGESGQVQVVAVAGAQDAEPGRVRLRWPADQVGHRFPVRTVEAPIVDGLPVEPQLARHQGVGPQTGRLHERSSSFGSASVDSRRRSLTSKFRGGRRDRSTLSLNMSNRLYPPTTSWICLGATALERSIWA